MILILLYAQNIQNVNGICNLSEGKGKIVIIKVLTLQIINSHYPVSHIVNKHSSTKANPNRHNGEVKQNFFNKTTKLRLILKLFVYIQSIYDRNQVKL